MKAAGKAAPSADFPSVLMRLTSADLRQLIWLVEMAAVGCVIEHRTAWAEQLKADAKRLRGVCQ